MKAVPVTVNVRMANTNRRNINLVIGLGTGRCGTWSLYQLLNAQKGCYCFHEGLGFPWKPDLLMFWRKLYRMINTELAGRTEKGLKVISNVGWFWINYIPEMMNHVKNPKFICMTRPRQEVVESFEAYMPTINHWTDMKSRHWQPEHVQGTHSDAWPQYDLPRPEAIGAYLDEYHKYANHWAEKFPANFKIYPLETLNSDKGVKNLLKFAGFPARGQVREVGVKMNTREKAKGYLRDPILGEVLA